MSTTFGKFLEFVDAGQHKRYRLEKFVESGIFKKHVDVVIRHEHLTGDKPSEKFKKASDIKIDSIADLPKKHYARVYIANRMIPKAFWKEIFYAEKYKDFIDSTFPDHGKDDIPNDPRIVLLYTTPDQTITHVTGRALELDNKIRYVTVKITDERKVFGIHHVDPNEKVYVTEGQFDSMFLPNAVACGDANLFGLAEHLKKMKYKNLVLVFDNQPRNKEIVREVSKAISGEYNVVLLPYDSVSKDINEMVKAGMTKKEIKDLIDTHTFSGLQAHVKFTKWRKC